MPEQDFFAEEAKMARSALRNLVKQTGQKVQEDSDVRPLIRQRPWIALLAAAGGGLVTGYMVTPPRLSPEEKRRLRAIRKSRSKKHKGHHLQKQFASAFSPALRTFAATAAGALFHNFQQGSVNDDHQQSGDEYSSIPQQRIQI